MIMMCRTKVTVISLFAICMVMVISLMTQTNLVSANLVQSPCSENVDEVLIGDWDGDGTDDFALRYNNIIYMDTDSDGVSDIWQSFGLGNAEDEYLVGDWDGDGRDNIAIRRGNRVNMDTTFDGTMDLWQSFGLGNAEDEYLIGDWDGDGRDNVAIRRGNRINMDTTFDGTMDLWQAFGLGNAEDEYLIGDWDGDGRDNVAIRRGNIFYMDTTFDGRSDISHSFGLGNAEDEYLVGDWDGDGRDNVAVRRGNLVHMDNDFNGRSDISHQFSAPSDCFPPLPPSVANLNAYSSAHFDDGDIESGSDEFSAVTHNHLNGDIVIIDDEGDLFKYSSDSMIPIVASKQKMTIDIDVDGSSKNDIEGIAWMYGTTYAILNEENGNIHIVDLSEYSNGSRIDSAIHTIPTGIEETNGNRGAEGIAFKFGSSNSRADETNAIFYVVKEELGTTLYEVGWTGKTGRQVNISGLGDLSDVHYGATNGAIYIVSDKSNKAVQFDEIDWNATSVTVSGKPFLSFGTSYTQVEGITFNEDQSSMVIVSDVKKDGGNSYGLFVSPAE